MTTTVATNRMDYSAPRAYEELIAPRYAPVAERLVETAQLAPGDRVLEVGAGTGLVTREAVRRIRPGGVIIATDRSTAMLRVARETVASAMAVYAGLDYAAPLPFMDGSFDAVLGGLTYVQDDPGALAEMLRVLRPGGRMTLTMWDSDYLELRLMQAAREGYDLPPLTLGDPQAAAGRLAAAGFTDVALDTFAVAPRFDSVAAYLAYRRGFGVPVGADPAEHERFLAALGAEAEDHAAPDGSFTNGWSFAVLSATKRG